MRPTTAASWRRAFSSGSSASMRAPRTPWMLSGIASPSGGRARRQPPASLARTPSSASSASTSSRNRGLPPAPSTTSVMSESGSPVAPPSSRPTSWRDSGSPRGWTGTTVACSRNVPSDASAPSCSGRAVTTMRRGPDARVAILSRMSSKVSLAQWTSSMTSSSGRVAASAETKRGQWRWSSRATQTGPERRHWGSRGGRCLRSWRGRTASARGRSGRPPGA